MTSCPTLVRTTLERARNVLKCSFVVESRRILNRAIHLFLFDSSNFADIKLYGVRGTLYADYNCFVFTVFAITGNCLLY